MNCNNCQKQERYINGLCGACTREIPKEEASILDLATMIKVVADEVLKKQKEKPLSCQD